MTEENKLVWHNKNATATITQTIVEVVTLRDQFAMAALTGLLQGPRNTQFKPDRYCKKVYEIADAMMEARK